MRYVNFDLRIWARDEAVYRLQAEAEGHGEAAAEIRIDPDEPGLHAQLRRLAERDTDRGTLEALGSALFELLLVGDVETLFQRSFGDVEGEPELGLRLRLRIGPPEVAALPWELLYSRTDGAFVATRVASPVVRYVEIQRPPRELATPFPLRVLVAIPRGGEGLPPVSCDREQETIAAALTGLGDDARVTYLHELHDDQRVTWRRIREYLAEEEVHCVHFIGHGAFRGDRGYLALDGEEAGSVDYVADERFADLFANHPAVKLVVLNACESATLSTSDPLEGCAAKLVEEGVPAVVAMQYAIRDAAAVDFARSFYHSLFRSAERGRVDVAVSQGRHVLAANHPGQRELATPVLFMHTASGVLFVPERRGLWRNLPFTSRARDTLRTAQEATGSESELARFKRRVRLGRAAVATAFVAALLVFAALWIGLLDLLYLETGAEFAVMAAGDALAAVEPSDELRVVTIDGGDLDGADDDERIRRLRQREGEAIRLLSTAGARVIALDASFGVGDDGGFSSQPEAGRALVETIRDAAPGTAVVVSATGLTGGELAVPAPLRRVAAAGHGCVEERLGLTRSLPITVTSGARRYPSLALAAYAAYRGGTVLGAADSGDDPAVVHLPDAATVRFAVSEVEVPRDDPEGPCDVIGEGDVVAHRFLRLTPVESLQRRATTLDELAAGAGADGRFHGKLVLVGLLGVGDVVEDLSGDRPGVLWHADALDNLLRDEVIRPLPDAAQVPILLLLAGAAALLRLRVRRRWLRRALGGALLFAFLLVTLYAYGKFNILINPAYHLVAFVFAWWMAGRTGERWLR